MGSIYFPGLNGLRFIAAAVVAICHVEQRKMDLGYNNWFDNFFFKNAAGLGVTLFFVLSGFLITYLLLVEKGKYSKISLKGFYVRRILRIWPLYYLIIILACFILPHIPIFNLPGTLEYDKGFAFKFFMLLLILPNVLHILKADVPFSGQTWSIGVEEQFYLIWPLIFQNVTRYYHVLVGIILFVILAANGFLFMANNFFTIDEKQTSSLYKTLQFIGTYFTFFRISAMAIGGIGACLVFYKHSLSSLLVNKTVEIAIWILLIFTFIINLKLPYINHEFYSCLFLIIILNASSGKSIFHGFFENRIMNYLGKISYGFYMFHVASIVLLINILGKYLGFSFDLGQTILLNIYVVVFTILISSLSYELFEKRLLKYKIRFQKVRSGKV